MQFYNTESAVLHMKQRNWHGEWSKEKLSEKREEQVDENYPWYPFYRFIMAIYYRISRDIIDIKLSQRWIGVVLSSEICRCAAAQTQSMFQRYISPPSSVRKCKPLTMRNEAGCKQNSSPRDLLINDRLIWCKIYRICRPAIYLLSRRWGSCITEDLQEGGCEELKWIELNKRRTNGHPF
jgi:hypothetical protein